jgi:hypothetical protein
MSKYLVLKQLSSLIEKYTPKLGTLIQTLPDSDIFENPKTLTTELYTINGVNIPIVKPTPPQQPPLSLKTLNDLKKYLKDSKSKQILDEYIKQQEAYESQQKIQQPLLAIERAKETIKATRKDNQKAIEGAPSATMGKEKAFEDMDEKELALFIKRKDILISDRDKAAKLLIKLQQTPKEKLAIEAAPKAKAEPKPAPKAEPKPAPKAEPKPELTKEQALKDVENTFLDITPVAEAITAETTKKAEERDKMKEEILKKIAQIYKFKETLPFETQDEFDEYLKSMEKTKRDWKSIGGNTSTISTPLNNLKKLFKAKLEALEAERIKAEEEAQAKAERKAAKKAARKAKEQAAAKPE